MDEIKKILKKYFSIIIIILIIMGLLSNKKQLIDIFSFWYKILMPFLFAIFISYILSPIERFVENKFKFKLKNMIDMCTGSGCVGISVAKNSIIAGKYALNDTQRKIIELLTENNKLSASKLAGEIGVASRNIEVNLKKLKEQGVLLRCGSPKTGYWVISDK